MRRDRSTVETSEDDRGRARRLSLTESEELEPARAYERSLQQDPARLYGRSGRDFEAGCLMQGIDAQSASRAAHERRIKVANWFGIPAIALSMPSRYSTRSGSSSATPE